MKQLSLFRRKYVRRRTYLPMLTKQLKIRLGDELHDKIIAAAIADNRSINSEILHRLELSFAQPTQVAQPVQATGAYHHEP